MAKLKQSVLSFGARGTIGDALTFQERPGISIVRKKPEPRDPYTLAQAYHRWDYQDYLAEWAGLTNVQKQVWKTAAARHNMPGMAYFLKDRLSKLPDILGRWHLDESSGAIARDSGKQGNDGTIVGALHVTGHISYGLLADGLDDYVNCGACAQLEPLVAFTVEAWAYCTALDGIARFFCRANRTFELEQDGAPPNTFWRFLIAKSLGGFGACQSDAVITLNEWTHLMGTYDGALQKLYVDSVLQADIDAWVDVPIAGGNIYLLNDKAGGADAWFGSGDEFSVRNRALTQADATRHRERGYPS